jgi:Uncharacterized protein conserved in bacteria
MIQSKITTNLWFDDQAEEAARFYTSIFPDSQMGEISHYSEVGFEYHHKPAGSVMMVEFSIMGQSFSALNGGPIFMFNEAISFIINCDTAEELDYYWEKLSEGGDPEAQQCGWLKDKYGLSWQIVPSEMATLMSDPDTERTDRVMSAMFEMKKLDINILRKAFNGSI